MKIMSFKLISYNKANNEMILMVFIWMMKISKSSTESRMIILKKYWEFFFSNNRIYYKKLEERILSAQSKEPNKSSFRTKKKGKIIENKNTVIWQIYKLHYLKQDSNTLWCIKFMYIHPYTKIILFILLLVILSLIKFQYEKNYDFQ